MLRKLLVPLALGCGKPGNEIQTPMAIVILFGLISSTALNMLVLPALYLRYGRPAACEERSEVIELSMNGVVEAHA